MKRIIITAIAILVLASPALGAHLSNESVTLQGSRVVISYDLISGKPATVALTLTMDGRQYSHKDLSIEGDIGQDVRPGKGKVAYWNVLMDFPKGLHKDVTVELKAGDEFMEMSFIQGGCFDMGCGTWNSGCQLDEMPAHKVCLRDYQIGRYEVTQKQWRSVMGTDPSMNSGCDDCPVEQVSWQMVNEFIDKLNNKTGQHFRLPTEAEWEYAARSRGMKEKWAGATEEAELDKYAWSSANAGMRSNPVGSLEPNSVGLYDMTGNVWEMCSDWYGADYYEKSDRDNPTGPKKGNMRVARGGSFFIDAKGARTTIRSALEEGTWNMGLGFRLARTH